MGIGEKRLTGKWKGGEAEKISWLKNDSWEKKIEIDHERTCFCGIEWS